MPAKILLVSPSSPFSPRSGAAQRTALLLDALRQQATVDFVLLRARQWWALPLLRLFVRTSPLLRSVWPDNRSAKHVARLLRTGAYQAVVLRYSATACRMINLKALAPQVLVFVDTDDFLFRVLEPTVGQAARRHTTDRWIEARERAALRAADGLWVTDTVPPWLQQHARVVVLPNIPFRRKAAAEAETCPVITAPVGPRQTQPAIAEIHSQNTEIDFLGVAQFRHPPNVEGFDWFLTHVWPAIRAARPDATLRLVGMAPPRKTFKCWGRLGGVEIVGESYDLTRHYAVAKVALAPILRGAGTKVKVLEALDRGLPCVCTRHAAIGLDALASLIVVNDPIAFAQACLALVGDAAARKMLAAHGRREIDKHFSRAHFESQVRALVQPPLKLWYTPPGRTATPRE